MDFVVGTYTRQFDAEGLYRISADADGSHASCRFALDIENPSWLIRHPSLPVLYSVIETQDDGAGEIAVIDIGEGGSLKLRSRVSSMGADPCHLSIAAGLLIVSNYSGGSLAAWPLAADGGLQAMESLIQHNGASVDPMRQRGPHVHSVAFHANTETAIVCDLGVDRLYRYAVHQGMGGGIDVMSRKTAALKPGAGPRMMCIDGKGQFGYVLNELDNTIVSYDLIADERPVELSTIKTLPAGDTEPSYAAHIALDAGGDFLYASNRGHDSIAVFSVGDGGKLELVEHVACGGSHPRFFLLVDDDRYLWVANRDSDNIVAFARDAATGRLEATGAVIDVPAPVCIVPLDQD